MRKPFLFFALLFFSQVGLSQSAGWTELPNTKIRSVVPCIKTGPCSGSTTACCVSDGATAYQLNGPQNITAAWNSAMMDTTRNRLIIWGGGHNDYFGNEVYSLDLNNNTMSRVTNPSLPPASDAIYAGVNHCPETLDNGTQPNSRHTYDSLTYMIGFDKMFAFGGSRSTCGFFSRGTYALNLLNLNWEIRNPTGTLPDAASGIVAAYDPNSGKVYVQDDHWLYRYDYLADSFTRLNSNANVGNALTGVIDPTRKKLIMIGGGQSWIYDLSAGSNFALTAFPTTGGVAVVSFSYPGLAYDPVRDRIVAWIGGDSVYSLNLDTAIWTLDTFPGGPGAPPYNSRIFHRWNYSPQLNAFVIVNSIDQNAFLFRFIGGPPPPPDTTPPSPPTNLRISSVMLNWTESTDDIGVSGYKILEGENVLANVSTPACVLTLQSGNHLISIYAYDAALNQSQPGIIQISIP